MKVHMWILMLLAAAGILISGCDPGGTDRQTRTFEMTDPQLELVWTVTRDQELACGGQEIAGGENSGEGTFGELGRLTISTSAAWDIGNLLDDADKQFEPVSPNAAGPAAPVLGQADYPYDFQFNPLTNSCLEAGETGVSATGQVLFTAENGDQLFGRVTGGETYRLDFVVEGDGIETFAIVEFDGGTGEFDGATGSFTVHTINRFDFGAVEFVIDLAEVLPGGTITY